MTKEEFELLRNSNFWGTEISKHLCIKHILGYYGRLSYKVITFSDYLCIKDFITIKCVAHLSKSDNKEGTHLFMNRSYISFFKTILIKKDGTLKITKQ